MICPRSPPWSECLCSLNSHVGIPMSSAMALEGGAFGRYLGHEGGALLNEIRAFIKETPERPLTPLPLCEGTVRRRWL